MAETIVSREEVAELAAQDVRVWAESGKKGSIQNRFPALSAAAKLYDIALKRAMGSDDEESPA